jgi:hypothetical protein
MKVPLTDLRNEGAQTLSIDQSLIAFMRLATAEFRVAARESRAAIKTTREGIALLDGIRQNQQLNADAC